MRVTFDTNTLDKAVRPERHPRDALQADYLKVHEALSRRAIEGFFCETLIIIEGVQKIDRATVLASTRLRSEIKPETVGEDGIVRIPINLTVEQQRPPLPQEISARVRAALALGLRVLGVPRIGQTNIDDADGTIYVNEPDNDARAERINRYVDAATAIESRQVGVSKIRALADKFSKRDQVQENWHYSLVRAKDIHEENEVKRAFAEWADGDSIAAHIGYGLDVFCTGDTAKRGRVSSVFDTVNRAWLEATYSVRFATLSELAAMI
jgi:hypothetical protein